MTERDVRAWRASCRRRGCGCSRRSWMRRRSSPRAGAAARSEPRRWLDPAVAAGGGDDAPRREAAVLSAARRRLARLTICRGSCWSATARRETRVAASVRAVRRRVRCSGVQSPAALPRSTPGRSLCLASLQRGLRHGLPGGPGGRRAGGRRPRKAVSRHRRTTAPRAFWSSRARPSALAAAVRALLVTRRDVAPWE